MRISAFFVTLLVLMTGVIGLHAKTYETKGVVVSLYKKNQSAVIRHEEIPGLMPAMTMPFAIPNDEDFERLSVNDEVRFEFVMDPAGSYAQTFEVIGHVDTPTDSSAAKAFAPAQKLEAGSVVPSIKMVDQDDKPIDLTDKEGRFTVMTFIFTRCPVPDFCPLMSSRFADLQGRFKKADVTDSVRLLSITIDPEFDTTSVLKEYGKAVGADFKDWSFATAEPEVINQVASAFRLYREEDGSQINHALCTALIDPRGRVIEIWRGNAWSVDAVYDRTTEFIEKKK